MFFRLLKLTVSLLVAIGGWLTTPFRPRAGRCVVINYHSIAEHHREQLARQLDLLVSRARLVAADSASLVADGARNVAVTVDDVFCGFVRIGITEMCRRGIPVLLFVPTGYLGRKSSWDDYGGENPVGEEVISADELGQLARNENIRFGSHTVSHPNLVKLGEPEALAELEESKAALEKLVGRRVDTFSFPYGSHGARELNLVARAGYRCCFDSTPETLRAPRPSGLIGRVDVQPTDWEIEFRLKIAGAYGWIRQASVYKRRLQAVLKRRRDGANPS